MNKRGASKGKVLIITTTDKCPEPLMDENNFLLCFDTYKQIGQYCFEHDINLDDVIIDELDKEKFDVI